MGYLQEVKPLWDGGICDWVQPLGSWDTGWENTQAEHTAVTIALLPQPRLVPCSQWSRDSPSLPQDSAKPWDNKRERRDYEMKTEVLSVLEPLPTSSPKPRGLKTQTCLTKKKIKQEWPMHSYPGNLWELSEHTQTKLQHPCLDLTCVWWQHWSTCAEPLQHKHSGDVLTPALAQAQDWVLLSVQMDCSVRTCE